LGALFEEEVRAIYVRGGLSDYQSALEGPFGYLPYDAVVPQVLTGGDLPDLAAALAPRPLRLEVLVDGLNRKVAAEVLARRYQPAQAAYAEAKAADRFRVGDHLAEQPSLAAWLKGQLDK
jgi:hypothetical protein